MKLAEGLGEMVTCVRRGPPVRQPEITCAKMHRQQVLLATEPERVPRRALQGNNTIVMARRLSACAACPHAKERYAKFDPKKIDALLGTRPPGTGLSPRTRISAVQEKVLAALREKGPGTVNDVVLSLKKKHAYSVVDNALRYLEAAKAVEQVISDGWKLWRIPGDGRTYQGGPSYAPESVAGPGWKEVPGYGGDYRVSNDGRVWGRHKGDLLRHRIRMGVHEVRLQVNEKLKAPTVARLMWDAWRPNEPVPKGMRVGPIDGDRDNLRLENLRIMSVTEYRATKASG